MPKQFSMIPCLAIALTLLIFGSTPALANDIADCNQTANPELQITGCTGFIQSGASGNNLAIAYANRGIAYSAKDETEIAIGDFDKAIEANPGYVVAYYNRGVAFSELGDFDRAIADFDKAIALNPDDPDAYDSRGFTFHDMRNFDRAIADFDKAIELDPTFAAAYYHRGIAYGARGDLDPGIADYDKAIELGCLRHGWCPPR